MCSALITILFEKKTSKALPVSGKAVPLHPQMRDDRLV
jgi:hypothetical protein